MYSPLTIHATSLCLDVIYHQDFKKRTLDELKGLMFDIAKMIYYRCNENRATIEFYSQLSEYLAAKIVEVLCYYRLATNLPDSAEIMRRLEQCIQQQNARL